MADQIAAEIEEFVRRRFAVAQTDTRFGRSVPLFDLGYVDSVGVIELLTFIESEFDVKISDDDLVSDEFTTIDGIAAIVARRRVPSLRS